MDPTCTAWFQGPDRCDRRRRWSWHCHGEVIGQRSLQQRVKAELWYRCLAWSHPWQEPSAVTIRIGRCPHCAFAWLMWAIRARLNQFQPHWRNLWYWRACTDHVFLGPKTLHKCSKYRFRACRNQSTELEGASSLSTCLASSLSAYFVIPGWLERGTAVQGWVWTWRLRNFCFLPKLRPQLILQTCWNRLDGICTYRGDHS